MTELAIVQAVQRNCALTMAKSKIREDRSGMGESSHNVRTPSTCIHVHVQINTYYTCIYMYIVQCTVYTCIYTAIVTPDAWYEDAVDSAQFDIDLETEVGEGLSRWLHHILHLHTLRGHTQQRVSHPLHLGY